MKACCLIQIALRVRKQKCILCAGTVAFTMIFRYIAEKHPITMMQKDLRASKTEHIHRELCLRYNLWSSQTQHDFPSSKTDYFKQIFSEMAT